jgi:hypothetical protein
MHKFLKIVGESLANMDNPQSIFYIKIVDAEGNDTGFEPIQLRGTSYTYDIFNKIQDVVKNGSDVDSATEEDNEVYAGAEALSNMGAKDTTAKLNKFKDTVRSKKSVIDNTITRLTDTVSKLK